VRVDRVGSEVVVEVADDGPGLSAEDAQRVFERFFRSDPSRSRSSGGTGLGLSIVGAIVSAHSGQVSAAPRPTGGAVFTVRLPAIAPATDGDADEATVEPGADGSGSAGAVPSSRASGHEPPGSVSSGAQRS
jgi:two-component system OmpR family sensor kinase